MEASTHLCMVKSEMYDGKWERFFVRRPARLMAVSPGLVGITTRSCEVIDISRGGASLTVSTTIGLPTHYYLQIIGLSSRIGCAEIHRRHGRVAVKFIMPLSEQILHRVVRAEFLLGEKL